MTNIKTHHAHLIQNDNYQHIFLWVFNYLTEVRPQENQTNHQYVTFSPVSL